MRGRLTSTIVTWVTQRCRVIPDTTARAAMIAAFAFAPGVHPSPVEGSSHMDAPRITFDDAANTTDVYAFVSRVGDIEYLTTALGVYPFEEPGIGPNKHAFDDDVRYDLHVVLGDAVTTTGDATISYQFQFETIFRQQGTILQAYLGMIGAVGDANQNLVQRYRITKVDRRGSGSGNETLFETDVNGNSLLVPPNNQGIATPEYNTPDGNGVARDGVATEGALDAYTQQTVFDLANGARVFAGQREDGFYGDILAIFDLLQLRSPGVDAQGGFNVHTIVLQIPISELGGPEQIAGVYATTNRRKTTKIPKNPMKDVKTSGQWIQVARQGNPLFAEALVALRDKDLYSRSSPELDDTVFRPYAESPELAVLLNDIVLGDKVAPETERTDLAGIFIPDLIKVDLSTGPVPLAGGGPVHATNPDDAGFHRLSVFGGDTIFSPLQGTMIAGGWPNGRRFGDDVIDIAVSAVLSDLRVDPPVIVVAGDNVDTNDAVYHKVMPYAGTPLNGRTHVHP